MFHRHFIKRLCSCSQYRLNKRKELDFEFLLNTKNADYIQACIAKKKSAGDVRTLLEINSKIHSGNITDLERENLLDELEQESLKIPNCIHPSVFEYESPKLVDTVNLKPSFNFEPKSLSEIAHVISGLHHKNMGNITGNGSYAFSGPLALLEEALIQYVVTHLLRRGFTILSVPDMLYSSVIEACGMQVRGQRSQVYSLKNQKNLCLSGTAEMAFGGYLKHRRLDHSLLPLRYASVSRCFRAEEAAVKAERGIYRVHAFTKVEMFGITSQETGSESEQLYSEFIDLQRNLFSDLDLHFKILEMPPSDLGNPAFCKTDIEAWMPGRDAYGEISSCSNCTDYQSRRLDVKYRDQNGHLKFVHTVNGTAVAVPRMIIALCESNQLPDGRVALPRPLQLVMKKSVLEAPEESLRLTWIPSNKYPHRIV